VNLESPYRGLAAFEDSDLDALYFFGRERDSEIVVANLIASRLTVLYGPSGVGKSSLLLASVARALREPPEQGLARAIADAAGVEPGALVDVATRTQAERDLYLILDQAEEYFTYHGADDGFDRALAELVDNPLRVNILLSLREDSLAALDRLKGAIPTLFANVLRLDRLDRAAGRAAIVKPLERWNELEDELVTIEDELVAGVLDGVGAGRIDLGPGGQGVAGGNGHAPGIEAPYLQLVMQRLWEVERTSGSTTLRASTLAELGGAAQVVADHLERAIEALEQAERDVAARLFDHLVTPSGTKIAHEASDLATFAAAPEDVIRRVLTVLADHRILRTEETGRWEIFHDVLAGAVLGWKTRHEAERAVEQAASEARRRQRRLALVALAALAGLAVTAAIAVWAFVERDNAQQRAREARAHELEAHAATLIPTNSPLALALAAEAARSSPSEAAENVLREALIVDRLLQVLPADGPVLDVAYTPGRRILAADAGGHARLYERGTDRPARPEPMLEVTHDGPVVGVAPDRGGMLSGSRDGTVRFTPAPSGPHADEPPLSIRHDAPVVAVVPGVRCGDAMRCIASGGGRTLEVWDESTGRTLGSVGLPTAVQDIAPMGRARLLVRTRDTIVRVVDLRGRQVVERLDAGWRVDSIATDQGGRMVAAGLGDGSVVVWRADGTLVGRFETHLRPVLAVALAENLVLSGSADGTATVRDLSSGRVVPLPGGHGNIVRSVSLSRDGRFALTASADGTAKVWESAGGRLVSVLTGHGDAILDAAFSEDAESVVTGSRDGTARVWESGIRPELVISQASPPSKPSRRAAASDGASARVVDDTIRLRTADDDLLTLRGHRDDVNSVAFSADGSLLVTASRDHDARIWDAHTGALVHQLEGHFGSVADARFSPDGRWVVTAGPITAGLWNVPTGELVMYARGPSSRLRAVTFGPDSRTIVSRESSGEIRTFRCEVCGTVDELLTLAEQRLTSSGWMPSDEEQARYYR
jgi:WD40 repeat protein